MRIFVAVTPGRRFREHLSASVDAWRGQLAVSWVRPAGWHLTLQFLGDWPESGLDPLIAVLRREARLHAPFTVMPAMTDTFGAPRRPRVFFLHMQSGGLLDDLAAGVRRRVGRLQRSRPELPPTGDDKPFHAHLTLARVKRVLTASELNLLAAFDAGVLEAFEVESFDLLRSRLQSGGAVYEQLASFRLEGGR